MLPTVILIWAPKKSKQSINEAVCRVRLADRGPKRIRFGAEARFLWKAPNGFHVAPEKFAKC